MGDFVEFSLVTVTELHLLSDGSIIPLLPHEYYVQLYKRKVSGRSIELIKIYN